MEHPHSGEIWMTDAPLPNGSRFSGWSLIYSEEFNKQLKEQKMSDLLTDRQTTHGDFQHNAYISQHLKQFFRGLTSWNELTSIQRESIEMICLKLSRILSGRPDVQHFEDIAGYAELAMRELKNGN